MSQGKGSAKFAGKAQPFSNDNKGGGHKGIIGKKTGASDKIPSPHVRGKAEKYSGNC